MSSPQIPQRYQIPTHLNVPDKLQIPLFGVTLSLTMRQAVIYLFGLSTAWSLWQHLRWLDQYGPFGLVVHWGIPMVLALMTCLVALVHLRDRHLEIWGLIVLHYIAQPHIFIWQSTASPLAGTSQRQEAETGPQEGEAA